MNVFETQENVSKIKGNELKHERINDNNDEGVEI